MSFRIIHKDEDNALVKSDRNNCGFVVVMQDWLKHLVCVGDLAILSKSKVTGEWIMTDYVRNIDNEVEP